jgi:hypothetical protein
MRRAMRISIILAGTGIILFFGSAVLYFKAFQLQDVAYSTPRTETDRIIKTQQDTAYSDPHKGYAIVLTFPEHVFPHHLKIYINGILINPLRPATVEPHYFFDPRWRYVVFSSEEVKGTIEFEESVFPFQIKASEDGNHSWRCVELYKENGKYKIYCADEARLMII